MQVLMFGIAKDIVGQSIYAFDTGAKVPSSVRELKYHLIERFPELGELTSLAIAVNSEYAANDVSLKQGDEIALIPPVSGG